MNSELIPCSPYIIAGLKDMGDLPKKRKKRFIKIIPELVFTTVSKYLDIPVEQIKNKSRKNDIVYARKLCVFLIRKYTTLSLKDIGEYFIGTLTDHTSVLHCQRFIQNQISGKFVNQEIFHDLQIISSILKNNETVRLNSISNN